MFKKLKFRHYAILLFFCCFVLYINTISNQYALDDDPVIAKNEYVKQGLSGLPKIFSSDLFEAFYNDFSASQKLSGGRYRPLSVATFAIEHQFFGESPALMHLMNVLLYGLAVVIIFYCFSRSFKLPIILAFTAAFLFAIHPVHTEVVANIKSRDEILSILFYVLTIVLFFKTLDNSKSSFRWWMALCYFAALLAKEYAATLLVVIPIAGILFGKLSISQVAAKSWILLLPFIVYVIMRLTFVGLISVEQTDPLNDPYMFARVTEEWATKLHVLLKYMRLLFYPHPLSSDYSFNQIPYKSFSAVTVIASITIYSLVIIFTLVAVWRKKAVAIAGVIFLVNLALIGNVFFQYWSNHGREAHLSFIARFLPFHRICLPIHQ